MGRSWEGSKTSVRSIKGNILSVPSHCDVTCMVRITCVQLKHRDRIHYLVKAKYERGLRLWRSEGAEEF